MLCKEGDSDRWMLAVDAQGGFFPTALGIAIEAPGVEPGVLELELQRTQFGVHRLQLGKVFLAQRVAPFFHFVEGLHVSIGLAALTASIGNVAIDWSPLWRAERLPFHNLNRFLPFRLIDR